MKRHTKPALKNEGQSFSIVIPIYNEELILKDSIVRLYGDLIILGYKQFEIILVENGSTDGTLPIMRKLIKAMPAVRLIRLPTASYGRAIKEGIVRSVNDMIIIFNVDFWDMGFLQQSLRLLSSTQSDLVVGSKNLPASSDTRSFFRRFLTYVFNVVLKVFFNFPGTDTHGIKALRQEKILPVLHMCRSQQDLFDTELVLLSYRRGLTVTELPIAVKELRPTRITLGKRIQNVFADIALLLWFTYVS